MIEDDFYRASSQFRLWSFTEASLASLRAKTNANASERVRTAIRRARETRTSATPSAAGTPSEDPLPTQQQPEIECLTAEEELLLVRYYCEQLIQLAEAHQPPLPTTVRATAIQYLRRFYLTNSPMTYHPKNIMLCALFLATKTDNCYVALRDFAATIPGDATAEDIIAPEFLVMQSLRWAFDVRHPFRGLEAGTMELSATAEGLAQPAPHLPHHTADSLRQRLFALPPAGGGALPPSSKDAKARVDERIARAHHAARETLKSAAQMTDAYFLYTPAQIWLAALLLVDRPLAEFYLETKIGGGPDEPIPPPFVELRAKLLVTLENCVRLLQSYASTDFASDPEQKKNIRRIGKKLYHCQNPDKANLAGQKRIPAAAAAAATTGSGGEAGTPESEMERLAKKRKLEREQEGKDLFGGDLVTQRTKEKQADR
ncbi:cyclin-like protein [Aspergillus ambiguus]|uniref:TFIIH complex kinase subunit CCL1 n=1 Tax=Aspergillus ambiguus TaxID=176160 RepID=UPI003CCC970B